MTDFEVDGQGFDGYAFDIEWVEGVPDHTARNAELLELTEGARAAAGDAPLAAIVFSPVATEVVNPAVWPEFPWTEIATVYDVWMPMAYWTFRDGSAYRDPYVYATESVERLRANLGDPDASVHPIGGIADESTVDDYTAFLRARDAVGAIGWSVYDWDTTATGARSALAPPPG